VSSEFHIEASTLLSVPDHLLLRRSPPLPRFRRRPKDHLVLSVLEEQASSGLTEEEARKFGLIGSTTRVGYDDAAMEFYLASNGNGSANRNGAAVEPSTASGSSVSVVSGPAPEEDERRRKKRVEEISKEDAWFKRSDGEELPKVNIRLLKITYAYVCACAF
jgi:hypothetical protein